MRIASVLLLVLPFSFAANQPTFTYTVPIGTTVTAIAVDKAGNTYLTGSTISTAFPATPGALQTQFSGGNCVVLGAPGGGTLVFPCTDTFVVKLDPRGAVLFATYLGGDGSQTSASAVCVDADGNVYVGGTTSPNNLNKPDTFPVTPGAAFTRATDGSGFVAKVNAAGSQVVYSTFLPLSPPAITMLNGARPLAMAIDSAGDVYIASTTQGALVLPTTPGAFQVGPQNGNGAGAVVKLNPSGSVLAYATYLSGSSLDIVQGIAIDAAGNAFITGYTKSQDFPVTPGAFQTNFPSPQYAGFVTKLNSQGTGLVYSSFVGQATGAGPWEIKVDSQDGAYVLGQGSPVLSYGGFLSHLSADGSALIYSTFLPTASGFDLDSAGSAFVAGVIGSAILDAPPGAFQTNFAGGSADAFAVKVTPDGQLGGATYLGGSQQDVGTLIAVAPNGSVTIAGTTQSSDFPGISGPVSSSAPAGFVTSIFPALTVENAASLIANTVAPGEIVTIRGYGLGPATAVVSSNQSLPTQLAGVQVSFGRFAAPLFSVQSQQITAQVPWEIADQTTTEVAVSFNGPSATSSATLVAGLVAPGIFAVSNSDGTQNSSSNPTRAGDVISIYGTGGGFTRPLGVTGGFWPITTSLPTLTLPVSVTIGVTTAAVLYAGSAPTLESGYFQINVLVPASLPPSTGSDLYVKIGSTSNPAALAKIAVR